MSTCTHLPQAVVLSATRGQLVEARLAQKQGGNLSNTKVIWEQNFPGTRRELNSRAQLQFAPDENCVTADGEGHDCRQLHGNTWLRATHASRCAPGHAWPLGLQSVVPVPSLASTDLMLSILLVWLASSRFVAVLSPACDLICEIVQTAVFARPCNRCRTHLFSLLVLKMSAVFGNVIHDLFHFLLVHILHPCRLYSS
jgi:hypothetical protein